MSADTLDPFAFARQDEGDAELFALLAEYERREQAVEAGGLDDDEIARRCDYSREVQDEIEEIRPTTLRGVLALLDYHCSLDEGSPYRFQPGCEAIEGLRDIVAREAKP